MELLPKVEGIAKCYFSVKRMVEEGACVVPTTLPTYLVVLTRMEKRKKHISCRCNFNKHFYITDSNRQ